MLRTEDFAIPLSIGPDDVDGILAALQTAGEVGVMLIVIAAVLVGCAELDDWRKRRKHFGGV